MQILRGDSIPCTCIDGLGDKRIIFEGHALVVMDGNGNEVYYVSMVSAVSFEVFESCPEIMEVVCE